MAMKCINLDQLAEIVLSLYAERGRVLLALDGRCASGKTTSAQRLLEMLGERKLQNGSDYHAAVLHMDDFFLRPEQRTEERRRIPGENVDHERFLPEVLLPLSQGIPFSFRPYDCHTQSLREAVAVPQADIAIIEGAYSCHRDLRGYYDVRVFVDVDPELQRRRILRRNGEAGWQRFAELWIPLEEQYLAALDGDVFDYRLM